MHPSTGNVEANQPILSKKNNAKTYQAVEIHTDDSQNEQSDTESLYESNEDIVAKRLNGAKRINVLLG
jgi:hypothetical protein